MSNTPTPKPPNPPVAMLNCSTCGKLVKCTQAEVDRYMKDFDWPRCCDQVMSVYLSGKWPDAR